MDVSPERIRQNLKSGNSQIGVWGTGFIGFSTIAYYGNEGVQCIGFDPDRNRVERINSGKVPVHYDMESWLGFRTNPLVEDGLVKATTDYGELLSRDVPVHFVAVPTEQDGQPWKGALEQTAERLAEFDDVPDHPILVVIESTLTPGMTDDIVLPILEDSDLDLGTDIVVGVAPRRDWFLSPDKKLPTISRVFGGQNEWATDYMRTVLEIVCEDLVESPNHRHAELVKSVENAYRHVGITLANQLDSAYPDLDIREVLRMVGTKWNVPTYYPSVGIGGYCVPVASQYVLSGTDREDELSILQETARRDRDQPKLVADAVADGGYESVTVLGLAYKADLKVDVLSPTVPIVSRLQEHGLEVAVHDPLYDDRYIENTTGATSVPFPEGMGNADAVILVTDHRKYRAIPDNRILAALEDCELVIDNHRVWEEISFEDAGVEYHYTGDQGWLSPRRLHRQ